MGEAPRKTVGAVAADLQRQGPVKHSAHDQMREQLSEYEQSIHECVATNKADFNGDFYVVVLTKKERTMKNVIRNLFFARRSCPTPDYDQVVYKYHRDGDNLEFMWVVPAKDAVERMKENALLVPTDQYSLLDFVLKFDDGTLLRLSKKLNGERRDSNILS